MAWVGPAISAAASIWGSMEQGRQAKAAAKRADPFMRYRRQYGDMLQRFMTNPSGMLDDPAFKASVKFGTQGVTRMMAASGFRDSGNETLGLGEYLQSTAMKYMQQQEQFLSHLAGADFNYNPGNLMAAQGSAAQGMGAGIGQLGGIFGGMLGGGGSAAGGGVGGTQTFGGSFGSPNLGGANWQLPAPGHT